MRPRGHRRDLAPTDHALHRIRFWIFLIGGIGIAWRPAWQRSSRPPHAASAASHGRSREGRGDRDLDGRVEVDAATSSAASRRASTRCSRRSRRPSARNAASSPTRHTSCHAADRGADERRPPARGPAPGGRAQHALDEASVELDALTRLVSDLVELARGEERKLRIEDVQLDDLVSASSSAPRRGRRR